MTFVEVAGERRKNRVEYADPSDLVKIKRIGPIVIDFSDPDDAGFWPVCDLDYGTYVMDAFFNVIEQPLDEFDSAPNHIFVDITKDGADYSYIKDFVFEETGINSFGPSEESPGATAVANTRRVGSGYGIGVVSGANRGKIAVTVLVVEE